MGLFFLCGLLFIIGIYGIVTKKNIIKIIIGLVIIEYAINLFLVLIGYVKGGQAPIQIKGVISTFVDPLPQAMVLTSIVIGLGVIALVVAIALRLYEKYKTFDISKINRLKG